MLNDTLKRIHRLLIPDRGPRVFIVPALNEHLIHEPDGQQIEIPDRNRNVYVNNKLRFTMPAVTETKKETT